MKRRDWVVLSLTAIVWVLQLSTIPWYNAIAPNLTVATLTCAVPYFLKPALEPLWASFQTAYQMEVVRIYDNSFPIVHELAQARKADLILFEDCNLLPYIREQGLVYPDDTVFDLIYELPALLIAKRNPQQIMSADDLRRPGLRIIIDDPSLSGMGLIGCEMADRLDLLNGLPSRLLRASQEGSLSALLAGKADVIIGYQSLHYLFQDQVDLIPIPVDLLPGMMVIKALITSFTKDHNAAQALLYWLVDPTARDSLIRRKIYTYRDVFLEQHRVDDTAFTTAPALPRCQNLPLVPR